MPTGRGVLPVQVQEKTPDFWQILMSRGLVPAEEVARNLYLLRNQIGGEFRGVYFPSLTPDTTVYKVFGTTDELFNVFLDLKNRE